jgi:hypothetical protein
MARSTDISCALRRRQRGFLLNPFRFGGAPPAFANVLFLENNQGTDGSTSFTDATGNQTLTALGNAQIDTSEFIFGNSSALFDGTGDGVQFNSDITRALTDKWAVEIWFRPRLASYTGGTASLRGLTVRANSGGMGTVEEIFYYDTDVANRRPFGCLSGNKDALFRIETNFSAATWYYVLLQNDPVGDTLKTYIGSTPGAALAEAASVTAKGVRLGTYGYSVAASTDHMDGHVGPIRLTENYDVPLFVPTGLFPES